MSKVVVVSEGHIKNTKVIVDGDKKVIESLNYSINQWDKVGILTISTDGEEPKTFAFNEEEDNIIFHLDGDIDGEAIVPEEKLSLIEFQKKYK